MCVNTDVFVRSSGQKKQCQTMDFVDALSFKELVVVWECSDTEASYLFCIQYVSF